MENFLQQEKLPFLTRVALNLYSWCPAVSTGRSVRPATRHEHPVTVVCISDTHNVQPTVPPGDLLVHAGDLTSYGSPKELQKQLDWLNAQPHRYKVVIAGNHDVFLDAKCRRRACDEAELDAQLDFGAVIYLNNSSTLLHFPNGRALHVYGSPQTPAFGYPAFQHDPLQDVWTGTIPREADIVLSHGPPRCHLDSDVRTSKPLLAGSWDLLRELRAAKPQLVVCGHIHEGYGQDRLFHDDAGAQALMEELLRLSHRGGWQNTHFSWKQWRNWLRIADLAARVLGAWMRCGVRAYSSVLARGVDLGMSWVCGSRRIETKARAKTLAGGEKPRKAAEVAVTETLMINAALEPSRRDPRVKAPVVVEL